MLLATKDIIVMCALCQRMGNYACRSLQVSASVNTFFIYFYRQIPIIALFYSFKEPPLFLGVLQPNTKLQQAERLFENQLVGPESIANIGGK